MYDWGGLVGGGWGVRQFWQKSELEPAPANLATPKLCACFVMGEG